MHVGLPGALTAVWGTSARDVFVVGADAGGERGPTVLHFDGHTWRRLATGETAGDLEWMHGFAGGPVYMVGTGGLVLRLDPRTRTFARMETPGHETLYGVWGASPRDVWAVGGARGGAGEVGVVWHFDGVAWRDVTAALPASVRGRSTLHRVWGRGANDVWAVGQNGTCIHWDGTSWGAVEMEERGQLFSIHGNEAEQIAAGGMFTPELHVRRGDAWQMVELDASLTIFSVFVPEAGDPIAVGSAGTIVERRDGAWHVESVDPTMSEDFHAVWVDPSGGTWAVGGQVAQHPMINGTVWHRGAPVPGGAIVEPAAIAGPARDVARTVLRGRS